MYPHLLALGQGTTPSGARTVACAGIGPDCARRATAAAGRGVRAVRRTARLPCLVIMSPVSCDPPQVLWCLSSGVGVPTPSSAQCVSWATLVLLAVWQQSMAPEAACWCWETMLASLHPTPDTRATPTGFLTRSRRARVRLVHSDPETRCRAPDLSACGCLEATSGLR